MMDIVAGANEDLCYEVSFEGLNVCREKRRTIGNFGSLLGSLLSSGSHLLLVSGVRYLPTDVRNSGP